MWCACDRSQKWREHMDTLSKISCEDYRNVSAWTHAGEQSSHSIACMIIVQGFGIDLLQLPWCYSPLMAASSLSSCLMLAKTVRKQVMSL